MSFDDELHPLKSLSELPDQLLPHYSHVATPLAQRVGTNATSKADMHSTK